MKPQLALFGLLLLAALLGGILALGAEHASLALAPAPTPTVSPVPTPLPTPLPMIVEPATVLPTPAPTPLPADAQGQQVAQLTQQVAQQESLLLVMLAQQHLALAHEALGANDLVRANQELVAAHAALDHAFERAAEELKQVIDNERHEVSRVRADLYIAPEGLDDRIRTMQDQLLALVP
ncbi:MAG: hypothetical protein H0X37_13400 [Herpetosiphonaceae bacterium]|nr:hypothetical protein [Herpetosiphonaceae bacterium]